MRESQKGAIDSSSNAMYIRVEADVFDDENRVVGKDFFAVCARLTETGELQIAGKWVYETGAGWPEEDGVMTEINERVEGLLEVLKTLRMPLITAAA